MNKKQSFNLFKQVVQSYVSISLLLVILVLILSGLVISTKGMASNSLPGTAYATSTNLVSSDPGGGGPWQ